MLLLKGPKYFKGLMWSKWHIEMPNPKGWPQSPEQCSTKYLVTFHYARWLLRIIIAAKKRSPLQVEPGKPGAEVSKRKKPKKECLQDFETTHSGSLVNGSLPGGLSAHQGPSNVLSSHVPWQKEKSVACCFFFTSTEWNNGIAFIYCGHLK